MRKMKDSGVEWIGEIPEEWEVTKVRYLFKIGRGRVIAQTELSEAGIYPVYSSQTKNNGCLGCINTYDFNIDQLTWTTDGANAGTVFLRNGKHNCTNVCGTLQPLDKNLDLRYQKYALEHISFYHKRADTNGYKIMNNEMAEICTIYPPPLIQHGIADFLDRKCAQIDAIITKQQEIIEKLKLYKQSVITEAVTKGLDPDVPMKDSGIEWLGEIPAHWKVVKLARFIVNTMNGLTRRELSQSSGDIVLRLKNILSSGSIDYSNIIRMKLTKDERKRYSLQHKDFLFVRVNGSKALVGKCAIYNNTDEIVVFNDHIIRVSFSKLCVKEYVMWYLLSDCGKQEINKYINTAAGQYTISSEGLKNICITVLTLDEQQRIVEFLWRRCTKIDSILIQKQTLIDKLTQYKKSLIYEAVTGKLEV